MYANRGKQKGLENSVGIDDEFDVAAVRMFRDKLVEKDLLPPSQDNYHTMLRFLTFTRSSCSKQYDYDCAILVWERAINWRRTNRVDTIIQDFVYKEHEDVRLLYPQGFHGVDIAGRPIYIKFANRINSAKMMKATTVDRFLKSYIQECEKMVVEKFPACSEIANKPIDSMVYILVIVDGPSNRNTGLKTTMYANKLAFRLTQILSYYYPQTVHQYFYINAGICGKLLIRLNNWLCDPRKRPVKSYTFGIGQDYRTKLLEFVDEDQLPTLLGGSCTCPGKEGGCLRFEKGPWEDKKAEKILPETIQPGNAKLPSDSGSRSIKLLHKGPQLCPEMACHKYTPLEYNVNLLSSKLDKLRTTLDLPSDSGSALCPEMACHKCTQLEYNVNLLSSKLDKLQATLDLLSSAQDRPNWRSPM